jgi:hypothetical protein
MVSLLIGAAGVAGAGIVWVGYKAYARITAWGERMNEIDEIFRTSGEGQAESGQAVVRVRTAEDGRANAAFGTQHLPTGPAASR